MKRSRRLAENVPLRRTTDWEYYATDSVIPLCFGACEVRPVRYSQDGRVWAVDGTIQAVDAVTIDGVVQDEYRLDHVIDIAGHPISTVTLNNETTDAQSISWTVRGQVVNNQLITNPADILTYLYERFGILTAPNTDLFRRECDKAGYVAGGAIEDGRQTCRSISDHVNNSFGGIWSFGINGICRLFPFGYTERESHVTVYDFNGSAASSAKTIANVITIKYGMDIYDIPKYSIQARNEKSIAIYGEIRSEIDAWWLSSAKNAEDVARRTCAYSSLPRWSATLELDENVNCGDNITIISEQCPFERGVVTSHEYNPLQNRWNVTVTEHPSIMPKLTIRRGGKYDRFISTALDIVRIGGELRITVIDESGKAISNAKVTLIGIQEYVGYTATDGITMIACPVGTYKIRVDHDDYGSFEMDQEFYK